MSENNVDEFRKRLKKYQKSQRGGFGAVGGRGGIYRRRWMPRIRMPWFSIVVVLTLVFLMKAIIVLRIGEDQYRHRLAAYRDPGLLEQVGMFVMQPDPVTLKLRDLARPLIGGRRR